jgi:hypothetical protein
VDLSSMASPQHIRVGTTKKRVVPGRRGKSTGGTPLLFLVEPEHVSKEKGVAPAQTYIVSIA